MNIFRRILMAAALVASALCVDAQPLPSSRPGFNVFVEAALPDGKRLLAGTAFSEAARADAFGIGRLNADGSVDTTFGDGLVRVPIWGYVEYAVALAVQPDGSIFVAGSANDPITRMNPNCYPLFCGLFPVVVKLLPDGRLDTSFNGNGRVALRINHYDGSQGDADELQSIVVQADGKVVVHTSNAKNVARINADGTLDTSFVSSFSVEGIPTPSAGPPATANFEGLWWGTLAESGWNITFSHQGDVVFAVWATYDAAGKPTWFSMTATQFATASFSGTLYKTTGPRFDRLPFDPSEVTIAEVGTAVLVFSTANEARFAYAFNSAAYGSARTRLISRYALDAPQPTCTWNALDDLARATNFQGLWVADPAGSEPGWAVSVADFGWMLLVTWFTYDVDGSPTWFFGWAPYGDGPLVRTTGPSFLAPTFDPKRVTYVQVGLVGFDYRNGNHLTFNSTVNGVVQNRQVTRFIFRGSGTACSY
jgi:uncharacterized delta-60 repeat protein